jgi:hypothetical protein
VTLEELIREVDSLEDRADGYVTLDEVRAATREDVGPAVESGLLLVDFRQREDGTPVTLCRLNRRHPLVKELTAW